MTKRIEQNVWKSDSDGGWILRRGYWLCEVWSGSKRQWSFVVEHTRRHGCVTGYVSSQDSAKRQALAILDAIDRLPA